VVLGQFLSAEEHREWVSAIVGFMHLPDLHCVIYQVVVDDLHMHSMSGNVCTCHMCGPLWCRMYTCMYMWCVCT